MSGALPSHMEPVGPAGLEGLTVAKDFTKIPVMVRVSSAMEEVTEKMKT